MALLLLPPSLAVYEFKCCCFKNLPSTCTYASQEGQQQPYSCRPFREFVFLARDQAPNLALVQSRDKTTPYVRKVLIRNLKVGRPSSAAATSVDRPGTARAAGNSSHSRPGAGIRQRPRLRVGRGS